MSYSLTFIVWITACDIAGCCAAVALALWILSAVDRVAWRPHR